MKREKNKAKAVSASERNSRCKNKKNIIKHISEMSRKAISWFKENYIIVIAAIALLIPDIFIRSIISPGIFGEPYNTVVPLLFSICWVTLVITLTRKIPAQAGRIVYMLLGIVMLILSFSNYIYYSIFGKFFWLSGMGLAGEATGYVQYAAGYITIPLIIMTLADLALLIYVCIKWKPCAETIPVFKIKNNFFKRFLTAGICIPVTGLAVLHVFMQPVVARIYESGWDSWSKPQVVYKDFTDVNKSLSVAGLYHFTVRDFWKTCFPHKFYSKDEYKMVDEYFESRPEPEVNSYTNIFKGKNVIAVMMESMDDWLINDTFTPTIRYMMNNGINFTDYYAPTVGAGYTFNSEYAFLTGYYTPKTAVSAVNFSSNSYPGSVARLFRNENYRVNSYHYNNSEFYNRGIMHTSIGFEKYNSFMDFGMTSSESQSDSNVLLNDEIYHDMIKTQPFFDFFITYSGHIPYTYEDSKLALAKRNHPELIGLLPDEEANNLCILARDTDDFFRQLLTRLNADGILENTVIIGFADHYAYGFSDEEKLTEYSDGLLMKVPAFIYTPGIEPVEVTKPVQTIDMLPTIINMFGLENNNCYIGYDAFDDRFPGFVHFPGSCWYDGEMYYIPDRRKVGPKTMEYAKEKTELSDKLTEINEIVVAGDYFDK